MGFFGSAFNTACDNSTNASATASRRVSAFALTSTMRALRRSSLQRPQWTLAAFLGQRRASELLPAPWISRVTEAQRQLAGFARRPQSPLDWAELVPRLLDSLHFAGARPLSSAEFQAVRRWHQAVEASGSLGFDGRRISWKDFLSLLDRTLGETLFAPQSRDAPIVTSRSTRAVNRPQPSSASILTENSAAAFRAFGKATSSSASFSP